jgi:hypothetical protein
MHCYMHLHLLFPLMESEQMFVLRATICLLNDLYQYAGVKEVCPLEYALLKYGRCITLAQVFFSVISVVHVTAFFEYIYTR